MARRIARRMPVGCAVWSNHLRFFGDGLADFLRVGFDMGQE
jgi:hypothetical protein